MIKLSLTVTLIILFFPIYDWMKRKDIKVHIYNKKYNLYYFKRVNLIKAVEIALFNKELYALV